MKNAYTVKDGVATVELTQGKVCLVDEADLPKIADHRWHADQGRTTWYVRTRGRREGGGRIALRMHRLLMHPNDGQQIDHRNHNGLDNRRSNLRIVTSTQNSCNQQGKCWRLGKATSKYPGVYWDKRNNRWKAQIKVFGAPCHLGNFDNELEAAVAYRLAKSERDALAGMD